MRTLPASDTAWGYASCKPPSPQATVAKAVPASLCTPKGSAGLLPHWDPPGRPEIWLRAWAHRRDLILPQRLSAHLGRQPELLSGKLSSSVKCRQSFALSQSEKYNQVGVCPCRRSHGPSWSPPLSRALPSSAHSLVGACQLSARASSLGRWVRTGMCGESPRDLPWPLSSPLPAPLGSQSACGGNQLHLHHYWLS